MPISRGVGDVLLRTRWYLSPSGMPSINFVYLVDMKQYGFDPFGPT